MKSTVFSIVILFSVLVPLAMSIPVVGNFTCDECKLPDCRCWNETEAPGNSSTRNPQLILLTFDYAIDDHIIKNYLNLFEGLYNDNGCPAKGTFFVQALNSDKDALQYLYKEGHELGINSANGIIPNSKLGWKKSISTVIDLLKSAGVPLDEIKGIRAPQLFSGGNDEFDALKELNLEYDASCVNVPHSDPSRLLWPYTLDYIKDLPQCSIGHNIDKTFPGIWSFQVPVFDYSNLQCPTPSGCIPEVNSTDEVFELFFKSFNAHYNNERIPFLIDIDALWVTADFRLTGTKQFLQLINAFPDTWIVTMSQVLKWMKNPDVGEAFAC